MGSTTSSPAAARARRRRRGAGRRLHGALAGGGRGRGGRGRGPRAGAAAAGSPPARCSSTSFLVTRPPRPVPAICEMSRPCSATMRATTGDMNERRSRLSPFASARRARPRQRRGRADDRHRLEVRRIGRGGRRDVGLAGARWGRGVRGGASAAGARRALRERRAAGRRAAAGVDHGDARADVDRLALGHEELAHRAGRGRGHLGVDLVGRDLDDRLVRLDGLADLLAPGHDRALGHADSHLRHDDIDERSGTHGFLPAISRRRACGRRPGRRRPVE